MLSGQALIFQQELLQVRSLNFLRPTLSDQVTPMLEVRRIVNKAAGEPIKLFFLMFAPPVEDGLCFRT